MARRRIISALIATVLSAISFAQSPKYVWIEAERPTNSNVKVEAKAWGHKELLSGQAWMQIQAEPNQFATLPVDGPKFGYRFSVDHDGPQQVWNRIGMEFVRSTFEWRVDDSAWTPITSDALTTDLMLLQDWNEVAWLQLGSLNLKKGDHLLEIRLPMIAGKRILYASDAICISPEFHPNGRFRPDEAYRTSRDEAASRKVFQISTPSPRSSLPMNGDWEIARDDEQTPGEVATPMPPNTGVRFWKAITVPSDKNDDPSLTYAHRVWYRTLFLAPEGSHGYAITFPANNLNTTVYVNGVLCGFNKNPYAKFDIDLSRAVKPGINTIEVGIRDAWYGYATNPRDPMKLRKRFNLPLSYSHQGFQDLAYPIWGSFQSGILATPILTATGSTFVSDVFVKPSVATSALSTDVTITNSDELNRQVNLVSTVIDPSTGGLAWTLPAQVIELRAGISKTVSATGSTLNPRLWWPDQPHLYELRTVVSIDGKVVDTVRTPFGFREWSTKGTQILLNGVPYHAWADLISSSTPQEFLKQIKAHNQHMIRLSGATQNGGLRWNGMSVDDSLDFLDRNGIVVRRSGILDGEAIGYMAIETDPDLQKDSPIKLQLLRNWRDQMVAQVLGERNHPSIMAWSLENEFLYINCINLYGGLMDQFESEIIKTAEAVRAVDPTRPTMTDGGGATKSNALPIHGDHYVFDDMTEYPARAYEPHTKGGGRGRWEWDQLRPRLIGEDFFANGINPADFATIGGEEAFAGKAQAKAAGGLVARILNEGYRWQHYAGWHLWMNTDNATDVYFKAFSERALFVREWNWTFGSGEKVKRTFGVFNDSHNATPIEARWKLAVGERVVGSGSRICKVAPGYDEKFAVTLTMPAVSSRTEAELKLALFVDGKEVFSDAKSVSILPTPTVQGAGIALYDPSGEVKAFCRDHKIYVTLIDSLSAIPSKSKVLVVGRNAVSAEESVKPTLTAIASRGVRIVVLEQENALHFRGLPAEVDATSNAGRVAFAENSEHPTMRGIRQKDFFTWGSDEIVYRNAYSKPKSGASSLVQCGTRLTNSALIEVPVGDSVMLLSQLLIGQKLGSDATAQRIFANLVSYAGSYVHQVRGVAAFSTIGGNFASALGGIGLSYRSANSALDAISGKAKIATIEANPQNLRSLASNLDKVRAFTKSGGWIVFNALTPEGLADYNRIVDVDHVIRPFRRERVQFSAKRNPLTAGLNLGDVVMLSSERIFDFTSDVYVAKDIFSYVVDLEDVAPFAALPSDYHYNTVNGFISADGWKLIFSFDMDHGKPEYDMQFPKAKEFCQFDWIGNGFYHLVKKVELTFDDKDKVVFDTVPNIELQSFAISPPRTAKKVHLRVLEWTDNVTGANVVGIDNLWLYAKRPASYFETVRPMLNVGGLVEYRQGPGGIVLCNLEFKDKEEVPENVGKKRRILSTILRNLGAPFAGGKLVVPGTGISVQPVDIGKFANQYRNERGWFGDKNQTFKDLPSGNQNFADVPFNVFEFLTSPVPDCVMLAGQGVPNNLPEKVTGIPVNRTASALFFLHTARVDRRDGTKAFAAYVIHFADGSTVDVPLILGDNVDSFKSDAPRALKNAGIAWTKAFDSGKEQAVAYMFQWDNPKPDVPIASVDLVPRNQGIAVPALLAISAAK